MSSDDRFSFILASVLAATMLLGMAQTRKPVVGGVPDKPRAGVASRPESPGAFPDGAAPERDEETVRADERVQALLRTRELPEFVRGVVFHPLAEAEVRGGSLEQGPPYHVVIGRDGSMSWTARGESGSPSQPPGLPVHAATKALHVALPASAEAGPARLASVRALWREAARRFGERGALFADEVPGATAVLPDGFDRAAWVAPQESRTSRARALTTQPSSQPATFAIPFGGATIQAATATNYTTRGGGLSGRKSLAKDEGLLFVYSAADERSFWMKGCLISLDILYLKDDGEVLAVWTAPPPDPKTPDPELPRYKSPAPCRLVLEVAGGFAAKNGVKAGSKLALPAGIAKLFEKADP